MMTVLHRTSMKMNRKESLCEYSTHTAWPCITMRKGKPSIKPLTYISHIKYMRSRSASSGNANLKLCLWPPWVNLLCDRCFLPSTWHFLKKPPHHHSNCGVLSWCQATLCAKDYTLGLLPGTRRAPSAESSRQRWNEHHPPHSCSHAHSTSRYIFNMRPS